MFLVRTILAATTLLAALNCGGKPRISLPPPLPARVGFVETGMASWYGHPYHGRRTSNGETYDMEELTAAHLQLPFNTVVRVTNLDNDQSVEVRINDRGPFVKDRIIDLSRAAAERIAMIGSGTAQVRIEVVSAPRDYTPMTPMAELLLSEAVDCGSGPYYGAQVGSFADLENAERMQGKMALAYGAARIYPAETGQGEIVYRVIVGTAGASSELDDLRSRLASDGIESFVQRVSAGESNSCT